MAAAGTWEEQQVGSSSFNTLIGLGPSSTSDFCVGQGSKFFLALGSSLCFSFETDLSIALLSPQQWPVLQPQGLGWLRLPALKTWLYSGTLQVTKAYRFSSPAPCSLLLSSLPSPLLSFPFAPNAEVPGEAAQQSVPKAHWLSEPDSLPIYL